MKSPRTTFQWPHGLRALRHRNFRLLWTGHIVSSIGTWMQMVAQGWLVFRLTDSPLMLGLVNVIALLPVIPVSLIGGVITERFNRRKLILITETLIMIQVFLMALLTYLDLIQVWHVILLSFGIGAMVALEQPARLVFVMDTVGEEDVTNAVALNASVKNAARIFGPALAGIFIALWGEAINFFLNGFTYVAVIAALLLMRLPAQKKSKGRLKLGISLMRGFRYMWQTKEIRALLGILAVSSFLTMPYITLMPAFAEGVLGVGSEGLGYLMAAVGGGAVVGSIAVANLKDGNQDRWLAAASITAPIFLLLFTFSRTLWLGILFVFFTASSSIVWQSLSNSMLQIRAAPEFRGRVMSIFGLLFVGMARGGAFVTGAAAEFIGTPVAVGIGAGFSLFFGVYVFLKMPHAKISEPVKNGPDIIPFENEVLDLRS